MLRRPPCDLRCRRLQNGCSRASPGVWRSSWRVLETGGPETGWYNSHYNFGEPGGFEGRRATSFAGESPPNAMKADALLCPACAQPVQEGWENCAACGEPLTLSSRIVVDRAGRPVPRWLGRSGQRAGELQAEGEGG